MKYFMFILPLFIGSICGAQSKNKVTEIYPVCMPSKLDYVSFCGVKFKVPRAKESGPNCCHADSLHNYTNLRCDNNGMVSWTYYLNEKLAKSSFEKMIKGYYLNKDILEVKNEPIDCYLLDKKVKGYKIRLKLKSVTTTTGSTERINSTVYRYLINAYGVVNGRHVIVELHSNKQYQIIKPMRQIIHL